MATLLYLNGQQVYPDLTQSIKLTKENPYFTQSESYTLEVTLPVDILENRIFFKNLHRKEHSKQVETMRCRLIANNIPVMDGSARITQITEQLIKIQLLGGNSEINFLSTDGSLYIDEMPLGTVSMTGGYTNIGGRIFVGDGSGVVYSADNGIRFVPKSAYDETLGYAHDAFTYNLLDLTKMIIKELGFSIEQCDIDNEPWDQLFLATANKTYEAAHTLPHWTLKTFFGELSKFFNVSILFDQFKKTVRIVHNPTFFKESTPISIEPWRNTPLNLLRKATLNL